MNNNWMTLFIVEYWFITDNELIAKEGALLTQTAAEGVREQVLVEVSQYLHCCKHMDWLNIIKQYPTQIFKEESGKYVDGRQWWKQFKNYAKHYNLNELWQYFDVMEWWNGVG